MKITMNETRNAVIEVLKNAEKPLTLAEISERTGLDVKSGSTNALVAAGVITKGDQVEVEKVVKVKVATYTLGNLDALESNESK